MPESTREGFSYFELHQTRPTSSDSHSPISPLSHALAATPRIRGKPKRPNLRQSDRSQSDSTVLRLSSLIPTIQEDFSSHYSTPALAPIGEDSVNSADIASLKGNRKRFESTRSSVETSRPEVSASCDISIDQDNHLRQLSRGLSKIKQTSRVDRSVSDNNVSALLTDPQQRSRSVETLPLCITPLRPPSVMTKRSIPISEHRITVETPFPDPLSQDSTITFAQQSPKRRSSINPRQLFSVPVGVFRKMRRRSIECPSQETQTPSKISDTVSRLARDHKSNLRRQQTTTLLVRVASMLQEAKRPDLKGRVSSNKTISSMKRNRWHQYRKDMSGSPNSIKTVRPRDIKLEDTESPNSSLANLTIAHPPNNTPDEQAKYIVINQYGEPEEFLKVDISVRGQTSYLPSEARRIHTPPLPSEDCSGTRRGFFFDYNLPFTNHSDVKRQKELQSLRTSARQMDSKTQTTYLQRATAKTLSRNHVSNVKTGDWYGTQLARIDSVSNMDCQSLQTYEDNTESLSSFELEQQQLNDEAQLDYNIPEHLPTSPLCPRHPRYWRVVKHKGNQFRGCWMHGIGEFDDQEKAKYKIVDRLKV